MGLRFPKAAVRKCNEALRGWTKFKMQSSDVGDPCLGACRCEREEASICVG